MQKQDVSMPLVEQVKLCAKAMGLEYTEVSKNHPEWTVRIKNSAHCGIGADQYWPITIEAQAMALVKRFMLTINAFAGMAELPEGVHKNLHTSFSDESVNHAIVACIASMQAAKNKEP